MVAGFPQKFSGYFFKNVFRKDLETDIKHKLHKHFNKIPGCEDVVLHLYRGRIAQLAEQYTFNVWVRSSSLRASTIRLYAIKMFHLYKEGGRLAFFGHKGMKSQKFQL